MHTKENPMHERRFSGERDRLRAPDRLERMEVGRVVDLVVARWNPASVLDVGTGTGVFAEAFAARGLRVAGVDVNPEMVNEASRIVPAGTFRVAPAEDLPFDAKSLDVVFFGHILHEADDAIKALSEAARVAVQGVAVLEWPPVEEEHGPPLEHRITIEETDRIARAAGFQQIERPRLHHMVLTLMDKE
jgi:ubiquinone/menaquinone biosynthesis C-methylase UbiE